MTFLEGIGLIAAVACGWAVYAKAVELGVNALSRARENLDAASDR